MNTNALIRIISTDLTFCEQNESLLNNLHLPLKFYSGVDVFLWNDPTYKPGCILLDVSSPGSQFEELRASLDRAGFTFPIICFGPNDVDYAVHFMKSGAVYYFVQQTPSELVIEIIRQEIVNCSLIWDKKAEITSIKKSLKSLTTRERQIVDLASLGLSNKQIAKRLGLSYRTIEIHRHSCMRKLNVHTLQNIIRMLYLVKEDPILNLPSKTEGIE